MPSNNHEAVEATDHHATWVKRKHALRTLAEVDRTLARAATWRGGCPQWLTDVLALDRPDAVRDGRHLMQGAE